MLFRSHRPFGTHRNRRKQPFGLHIELSLSLDKVDNEDGGSVEVGEVGESKLVGDLANRVSVLRRTGESLRTFDERAAIAETDRGWSGQRTTRRESEYIDWLWTSSTRDRIRCRAEVQNLNGRRQWCLRRRRRNNLRRTRSLSAIRRAIEDEHSGPLSDLRTASALPSSLLGPELTSPTASSTTATSTSANGVSNSTLPSSSPNLHANHDANGVPSFVESSMLQVRRRPAGCRPKAPSTCATMMSRKVPGSQS